MPHTVLRAQRKTADCVFSAVHNTTTRIFWGGVILFSSRRRACSDCFTADYCPPQDIDMTRFRPKYITFDCYGTLTRFRMGDMAREIFADRVSADHMEQFVRDFSAYRLDEVLGAWKPYQEVVKNAVRRTLKRWNLAYNDAEAQRFYTAVPTWGPHPDVPEGLSRLAKKYKLVILSNASNNQIQSNVDKLGAPFHAVFTARAWRSRTSRVMQGVRVHVGPVRTATRKTCCMCRRACAMT
jgi:2-haloalkanoic acid dehalogenase type II